LGKNLGKKNCELSDADRQWVMDAFLKFEETEQSKMGVVANNSPN